ncbi:Carboxymuconolactone decarboxylase family protein [Pseudomonas marincola]|jgi:alkylhydroperoxidase family enzyme|uniref:Carboxymuconolactone decarboxylase n=1 Tax=Pseudomonas marincola TaxID=437900 RepID=A0A653E3E8_9PSED|nr:MULTISPECIES: carboxymuconolactone decarboxylase family protein [Pseudomonas]MAB99205.1 carboxymuconolactone decarboxylase family protein [Pseudomonadaceae bacterium]OEO23261.1 carboxymuconolactone decarboxylase [Pseudomonas sp. J237]CAE6886442.1 Carboxymuconolactone decarboxylase family protein [Pseudomonas marincola]
MSTFKLHDQNTAPEASKPLLENSQKAFGMVPGLHAVMAESPGLLEGYQVLHNLFLNSSFTAEEQTVVWQSINVEHNCHYCVPAHTGIAKAMKVSDEISNALRDETPLPTPKLEALRDFTLAMVRQRGELQTSQIEDFYAAGFSQQNVLEVILALSQKVMSNYTNHVAQTPIDAAFKSFAWEKK